MDPLAFCKLSPPPVTGGVTGACEGVGTTLKRGKRWERVSWRLDSVSVTIALQTHLVGTGSTMVAEGSAGYSGVGSAGVGSTGSSSSSGTV